MLNRQQGITSINDVLVNWSIYTSFSLKELIHVCPLVYLIHTWYLYCLVLNCNLEMIWYTETKFVILYISKCILLIWNFHILIPSNLTQIGFKSLIFLACLTLKFDGWPRKTIGHLFYTMYSFVHHFKAIGEIKLELQSGHVQFRSQSVIFCPVWKTIRPHSYARSSFVHHLITICGFKLDLYSRNS